jgi:hypothetical protein
VKEEIHGATGQRKEELVFLTMLSELTILAAGRFADDPRGLSSDSDRVRHLICRELRNTYSTEEDKAAVEGCENCS